MSTKQIEKRLARLEGEFEQLKANCRHATGQGWRAVVGAHEDSATFESVVREMRRLRREGYKAAASEKADSPE